MRERIVIIGAGQAGARTALAARNEGWQGEIVLIGEEAEAPYERPPLSKQVLADGVDPVVATILSEDQCVAQGIELWRSRSVTVVDPRGRQVLIADGESLDYDHLVIATGTRPRRLPTPGWDHLSGIYTLRTAADARALAPRLVAGTSVVMVGGGFIGLEVAASAVKRGCKVTVLEAGPQVMGRMVDADIAEVITDLHRARGVNIRLGTRVEAFEGLGSVRRVRLSNGSAVDADVVVVGVGALPNDGLAINSGLTCAGGVMVDSASRTSDPRIFAVGDVARHRSLCNLEGVRLESWENAELQAVAAAQAILGKPVDPRGVPWFWTDQFDLNLQILGFRGLGDQTVIRGDTKGASWCAFSVRDGLIVGACMVNAGRERRAVKKLMDERVPVELRDLADAKRPLRSLMAAA
ncbi:MAG: FAD-dependent oxidoreductase [Rhodospirillum sp.]|nr:FAD-dependent oxidoreductase [Rhodospirillum sp.]MCF8489491.1 FAD-dependent oxidoreductase [Rhodospirillum sp.]MCF8502550.1 FAD-dependent oxidoreductase [Rhodospirillum sp.]